MRLWIDGQCLQTTSRLRGIGRYTLELIRAIAETCPDVEMSISFNAAVADLGIAARARVAPWIAAHNIHVWQGAASRGEHRTGYDDLRRLSEIALAHHVACLAPDMALSASPFEGLGDRTAPFLTRAGHAIASAAIFYDAIPLSYPRRYLSHSGIAAAYRRRMAAHRNFDGLLAISGFAQGEAKTLLPEAQVARIDAGVSPDFIALAAQPTDPGVLGQLEIRKPFMLYVGALDWRKNVTAAVEAFALLAPDLRFSLKFVLAGRAEPSDVRKVRDLWRRLGLGHENLILLDHIADPVLVQLYKQADLVLQPSLVEGFGLTALEAMICGVPVVASNTGALPEVVGDTRALFDPARPAAIAARITAVLSDPTLARSLVEHGLKRAREFSWGRTARLAVNALQSWAKAPPAPSRDALRQITRAQLGKRPRPRRFAALVLAAAEPPAPQPPRLLIDVTTTSYNDPGTGIQRVVNKIARELLRRPDAHLFWCDTPKGFFEAGFSDQGRLTRRTAGPEHQIVSRNGDHILMLDSSWGLPETYNKVMRQARLQGAEITSVLYDLVPLKMPAFCDVRMSEVFTLWIQSALLYSTGFVCISHAVADEFLALLKAIRYPRPMKVGYWRMGADLSGRRPATKPVSGTEPLFLMVGTLEPRKGHRVALDAFTQLWGQGFAGRLCIIGKRGWAVDHLVDDLKAHPEWGRKLTWLENADDEILEAQYVACTALVTSSHAEGFGVPIVEAASHGKPVICSDIPVFHEVAGDGPAATYFETGSPASLAAAVKDFLARHDRTPQIIQDQPLTWAQSAALLQSIVAGEKWYRIYQPENPASDAGLDNVGDWQARPLGTPAERRHRLELVEGPLPSRNGAAIKFTVRLTNESPVPWSSKGADGVQLGVKFGKGPPKGKTSLIPLVHCPGDTHTMALELETRQIGGRSHAKIALLQGKDDWWDGGLTVSLQPA